ncbi:MAG: NYN domain-containing protein [Parafannyhessea sp.]|jgi:predicted RNA-binding protein with PIN domain|uniref:NYN domain-containing protein n=1 Tax=Parafannyhessea sp. TaxID=2847324 RepID=UPI003F03C130
MARPQELLVVDGYNVIHKSPRYMALVDEVSGRLGDTDPFDRARKLLVADVAAYAQGRYEAVVVFDGAGNVSPDRPNLTIAGVRTVFSATGEEADSVIERIVTEARHDVRAVTVITSDNTIRATVGGIPVTRLSSDVLIHDVNAIVEDVRAANDERNHQRLTLEDRLDPKTRQKLDRLLGRI